jgi:hypothetical protein
LPGAQLCDFGRWRRDVPQHAAKQRKRVPAVWIDQGHLQMLDELMKPDNSATV